MSTVILILLYLLTLIVPGWFIIRLAGLSEGRPLFILASSYIYYALIAALSKWLNLPLELFYTVYLGPVLLLGVLTWYFRRSTPLPSIPTYWLAGLLLIIITYSLYHFFAGAYTEVPGDYLYHLYYTRQQLTGIAENQLGPAHGLFALLQQRGGIWYSLYALLTWHTGLDLDQALSITSLCNSLVFLCAVYGFAWYLFGHFTITQTARLGASVLAVAFTATHMGINVFAYIRYYALAPTMLNMVVYFGAVVAALELLRWQQKRVFYGFFLLLALVAATMVHNQEGLFILVMGGMMLGWFALYPSQRNPAPVKILRSKPVLAYRILLILFTTAFLTLVVWAYLKLERPSAFHDKIIQLSPQGPILNRILFLNPAFQGIEVITLWGLMVYALFLLYWKRFIGHPYLVGGMLIPFFTVFNPLFVDWFMRLDGVHTLWRLLYIVPIHFVGALSFVFLISDARHNPAPLRRYAAGLAILALFLLLLPLGGLNSNARLTLASVDEDDSHLYWQDLMDYLDTSYSQRTSILTDPVTGYMIGGLTRHHTYYRKFFSPTYYPINLPDYEGKPFSQYKGWLLIINDRDGGHSQTGEFARHWPEDILKTSEFYSDPLRSYIDANPDQQFQKHWEKDGIHVYQIR